MKNLFIAILSLVFTFSLQAQTATQTVKGQIIDKQSEIPIIGATIQWINEKNSFGDITDFEGYFKLENISKQ